MLLSGCIECLLYIDTEVEASFDGNEILIDVVSQPFHIDTDDCRYWGEDHNRLTVYRWVEEKKKKGISFRCSGSGLFHPTIKQTQLIGVSPRSGFVILGR